MSDTGVCIFGDLVLGIVSIHSHIRHKWCVAWFVLFVLLCCFALQLSAVGYKADNHTFAPSSLVFTGCLSVLPFLYLFNLCLHFCIILCAPGAGGQHVDQLAGHSMFTCGLEGNCVLSCWMIWCVVVAFVCALHVCVLHCVCVSGLCAFVIAVSVLATCVILNLIVSQLLLIYIVGLSAWLLDCYVYHLLCWCA
jgi:hypothetical protein